MGPKITEVFMVSQSSLSLGTALILVPQDRVIRINPQMPPKRFGLDVIKEIASLKGLGASEARKALPRLRPTFFNEVVDKFVPFRT